MEAKLINTEINRTTFTVEEGTFKGTQFRLTGYMFIYITSDNERMYAHVSRRCANAVSGASVCGCIVFVNQISINERISLYGNKSTLKEINQHSTYLVKEDKRKYKFLKSLPEGLTKEQVSKISMNRAVNSAMREIRKNKIMTDIKQGDKIEFYTSCNADRKPLKGTVKHKDQLGLITKVGGVQYELKKLVDIKKL